MEKQTKDDQKIKKSFSNKTETSQTPQKRHENFQQHQLTVLPSASISGDSPQIVNGCGRRRGQNPQINTPLYTSKIRKTPGNFNRRCRFTQCDRRLRLRRRQRHPLKTFPSSSSSSLLFLMNYPQNPESQTQLPKKSDKHPSKTKHIISQQFRNSNSKRPIRPKKHKEIKSFPFPQKKAKFRELINIT